ncbi:MAG: GNAT family N-acetyltransferase [Alphaproteobacteria bacterium]|nr:GNAT family N-acetyltransferase [Alphaproteobacteria bacterium]
MTGLVIERLSADSPWLLVVARWRHKAFLEPSGLTEEDSRRQLIDISVSTIPHEVALVAVIDDQPAGICLLVDSELDPLHDCSPWLASLFVHERFRRSGVGRALVRAIERHAASHAIAHLFLYTDAAEPFYARCGWAVQERFRADGMDCVLMKRDL